MASKKMKKIRKVVLTILFVLINIVVIAATALNEFGNSKDAAELSEIRINWWLLLPASICFLAMIFLEFAKYVLMIKRTSDKKKVKNSSVWRLAFRTVMLGRYYDRITPAAVGGQPFQIYYMRKSGLVSDGMASAIPVFGMISGQIAFLIVAVPCFLLGGLSGENSVLLMTAWFGLLFYAFWPVMVAIAAIFPKTSTRMIKFFVRILARLKIVKNRTAALEKIEHEVSEYVRYTRVIMKSPGLFGGVIIMSIISNLLIAFVPYFVLTAFGGNVGFFSCFLLTIAVEAAVYFIPTPGNSGAAEGTFYIVFSALSTGYVFWAMLFWRLYSYYIYIIMGPIIYLKMHLEKRKHN